MLRKTAFLCTFLIMITYKVDKKESNEKNMNELIWMYNRLSVIYYFFY